MAKGSPNGPDKILNGVLKVFDPKADNGNGAYRPAYIAPDATDTVQGDVLLSDAVNSNDDAATGITAATPKAVKAANDNAETKLSKIETKEQTVVGPVTFIGDVQANKVTATLLDQDKGAEGFVGNASSANKLNQARNIEIINGTKVDGTSNKYSVVFDGSKNVAINMGQLDAKSLVDMVPLSSIPKAALERLVNVADENARFALTVNDAQKGDTIYQADTGIMYLVVDDTKLNLPAGYQEYKAGSAVTSMKLGTDTIGKFTDTDGDHYQAWYLDSGEPKKCTDTVGSLDKPIYLKDGVFTPIDKIQAGVSGVKGDWETDFRDGDVNLTYEDIPAIGIKEVDNATLPDDEVAIDNVYDNNIKLTNYDIVKIETESILASPLNLEREANENESWYQIKVNTNIKIDSDISNFATATYFSPVPSTDNGDGVITIDGYNTYEEDIALERQEDGTSSFYLPKIYASQVVSNGIWVTYNTSTNIFKEYEFTNGHISKPNEFDNMGVKKADNFELDRNVEGVQEQAKKYKNRNLDSIRVCITTEKDAVYSMVVNQPIYDVYGEEIIYNIGDNHPLDPSTSDSTTSSSGAPLLEEAIPGQAFAYMHPGSYTITVTVDGKSKDTNILVAPKEKDQLIPLFKVKTTPYSIYSFDDFTKKPLEGALCYCMHERNTNTDYYCYNDESFAEKYGPEGLNTSTVKGYMYYPALPFGDYILSIKNYPDIKYIKPDYTENSTMMGTGNQLSDNNVWAHDTISYQRNTTNTGLIDVQCNYPNDTLVFSDITLDLINSETNAVIATSSNSGNGGHVYFTEVPFIPDGATYNYKIITKKLPKDYLEDNGYSTIPLNGFTVNQANPTHSFTLRLRKQCKLKVEAKNAYSLLQDGQSFQIYLVDKEQSLDVYHHTYTKGESGNYPYFTLKEGDTEKWDGFTNKKKFYVGVTNLPEGVYCKETPVLIDTNQNITNYIVNLELASLPEWPYENDYRVTTGKTIYGKSDWSFDFSFKNFTKIFDGYGSTKNPSGFAKYLKDNASITLGSKIIDNFTTSADFNNKTFNISFTDTPTETGQVRIELKSPFNDGYGVFIPGKMYTYIIPYIVKQQSDLYWEALVPHKPESAPLLLDETVYSNSKDLGLEDKPYNAVYANKFHGVADNVDKVVQVIGAVHSDPVSLKESNEQEITPIETSYPTGQGVVMISATQPTDPNVLIWIQP